MFDRGNNFPGAFLSPSSHTFGRGSTEFIQRSFVANGRRFRRELLHLLDDLASGNLGLQGYASRANRSLLRAYTEAFHLGALSVDPFHILTAEDAQLLTHEISVEQRFLKSFGRDIDRGFYVLNPNVRANLYLMSLRGIFELGRLQSYPSGPIEWILGDTHHCESCISASLRGPYRRSRWTHLDLPELPGIPGFGDVCNGFTRCGCTLKFQSQFDNPGYATQTVMRDLLSEIVYGSELGSP